MMREALIAAIEEFASQRYANYPAEKGAAFHSELFMLSGGLADAILAHARTDIPALLDEVERLRAEHAVLWERAVRDSARATRAEAHAERLAGALAGCLEQAEGCWLNHYGENPEGSPVPPHIDQARQALSAYRGEMKTVLGEASR